MQRYAFFTAVLSFFVAAGLRADTLIGTISSDTSLPAGQHIVSGVVVVAPGISLQFAALSTVRFSSVSASLLVNGTLQAAGTLFTGMSAGQKWGQLVALPGSTCVLTSCQLDNGGGNALPPPLTSNAVLYGESAQVSLSNCVVTRPQADSVAVRGGALSFVDNVLTSVSPGYGFYAALALYGGGAQPTILRSSGNSLLGAPRPGIWIDGTFTRDLDLAPGSNEKLHLAAVLVSNACLTIAADSTVAFDDLVPGKLTLGPGAALRCNGTPGAPVLWTNYYGINPWPGITWLPGSTGILSSAILTRALGHSASNAILSLDDVRFINLQNGFALTDHTVLEGTDVLFHGMVNRGVSVRSFSRVLLRECQFIGNNAPFITSLALDNTGSVDARYCWWDAPDGPYPFGAYGNEQVSTNGNGVFFPWLLAAPGSQTNPPMVKITSHTDPFTTPAAQVVMQGIATDATQVVRLALRNGRSKITIEPAWLNATTWQAQIWLYDGVNPIAVYAYDNEGNASVDAVLITCTGAGVGNGGAVPPVFEPIGTRHALVAVPLIFDVLATSPSEPALMTYWAANLPLGATFDPVQRQFAWTPGAEGVYSNISFFVTDGGSVATALCDIIATTLPTPAVRAISTPDMYSFQPYFYMAAPDGVTDALDWRFSAMALPEGVVASRAGIIAGIPLDLNQSIPLPFTVRALNAAGASSATVAGNINRYTIDTGARLRVLSYDLPAVLAAAPLVYQFTQTNGLPVVTWDDVNGECAQLGVALDRLGGLTGAVATAGMYPATVLVRDATNRTLAAQVVLPIVAPDNELRYVPNKNSLQINVSQKPTKTRKSTVTLRAVFELPAGFTLTSNDLAACRVGFALADAGLPYKAKLNKKNLFVQDLATRYTKIQVNVLANGTLKFSCTLKNADLRLHMAQYGIINEELPVLNATVPVWIQIGTRMTVLRQVPVSGKAKFNVFSKAKAKW